MALTMPPTSEGSITSLRDIAEDHQCDQDERVNRHVLSFAANHAGLLAHDVCGEGLRYLGLVTSRAQAGYCRWRYATWQQ